MTLEHKGSVELSCTPYAFITRMAISILLIDIRSNHLHQIHYVYSLLASNVLYYQYCYKSTSDVNV